NIRMARSIRSNAVRLGTWSRASMRRVTTSSGGVRRSVISGIVGPTSGPTLARNRPLCVGCGLRRVGATNGSRGTLPRGGTSAPSPLSSASCRRTSRSAWIAPMRRRSTSTISPSRLPKWYWTAELLRWPAALATSRMETPSSPRSANICSAMSIMCVLTSRLSEPDSMTGAGGAAGVAGPLRYVIGSVLLEVCRAIMAPRSPAGEARGDGRPRRRVLDLRGQAQEQVLAPVVGSELYSHGQPGGVAPRRQRDRRLPGHVEQRDATGVGGRPRPHRRRIRRVEVAEFGGGQRERRQEDHVHAVLAEHLRQLPAGPLRPLQREVEIGAGHGAPV